MRIPNHTCEGPDCSIKTDHTLCDNCWAEKLNPPDLNKVTDGYFLDYDKLPWGNPNKYEAVSFAHYARLHIPRYSTTWNKHASKWSRP